MPSRPCEEGGGDTSSGGAAAAAGPRTRSHYDPTHQVPAPAPGVCASSQAGGSRAPTSTGLAETSGTAASATACEAPQAEAPVVVGVPLSACSQALRRSPRLHKRPQPQTEQTQTEQPAWRYAHLDVTPAYLDRIRLRCCRLCGRMRVWPRWAETQAEPSSFECQDNPDRAYASCSVPEFLPKYTIR